MRMWKRIFGRADLRREETANAGDHQVNRTEEPLPPRDREAFVHFVAREGAWLNAKDIEGDQIKFIDYIDENGTHIWPLFSTQATAATWASHLNVVEIKVFQCLKLKPAAVLRTIPSGACVLF